MMFTPGEILKANSAPLCDGNIQFYRFGIFGKNSCDSEPWFQRVMIDTPAAASCLQLFIKYRRGQTMPPVSFV